MVYSVYIVIEGSLSYSRSWNTLEDAKKYQEWMENTINAATEILETDHVPQFVSFDEFENWIPRNRDGKFTPPPHTLTS